MKSWLITCLATFHLYASHPPTRHSRSHCAQASAHPLDVIRRRLQLGKMVGKGDKKKQPPYSNMFTGLYTVAKTEGIHVLFRGLGPACFEKVPSTAIGYYIYEGMKTALAVSSVR